MSEPVVTRPALRYHGGKWILAPWIISHFPPHRTYVEPFGGAMSVLLRKPRCKAEVYSELDGEITNLFRVLRNPLQSAQLRERLRLTPFSRIEFEASYERSDDPVEQARRTAVRSAMGFGSTAICRGSTSFRCDTRRNGKIPAHDWMGYPDALALITERLHGVVIESRPATEVMLQHDTVETLHYVDPPYPHVTRGVRQRANYNFEMSDDDHRELATVVRALEGMVVLSGYDCPLYDELFGDWECRRRATQADGAHDRVECLWLSPRVSRYLAQRTLFGERPDP